MWWLALLACGDEATQICRPGFVQGPDGHCYPPPPDDPDPSLTDALEHLPDCVPRASGQEIDLEGGCAAKACAGDTFEDLELALGTEAACDELDGSSLIECVWGDTLAARFDADGDLPEPDDRTDTLNLLTGYAGSAPGGLGTDITPRCCVEALGQPDLIVVEDVGGRLLVTQMNYDRYGLIVLDWLDQDGDRRADGVIDQIRLSGAP